MWVFIQEFFDWLVSYHEFLINFSVSGVLLFDTCYLLVKHIQEKFKSSDYYQKKKKEIASSVLKENREKKVEMPPNLTQFLYVFIFLGICLVYPFVLIF